jgi:hypothetical protein
MHGNDEVMAKPDVCTITDMKTERGFVYLNLNGGDSWAYYHPENNPDLIRNFKGEPAYLTKELLPDYWEQLHSKVNATVTSQGLMHLALCDKHHQYLLAWHLRHRRRQTRTCLLPRVKPSSVDFCANRSAFL